MQSHLSSERVWAPLSFRGTWHQHVAQLLLVTFGFVLLNAQLTCCQMYSPTVLPQEVPTRYTIGAALRPSENIVRFIEFVEATNHMARVLTFQPSTITMDTNPIRTAKRVCETLVKSQVSIFLALISIPILFWTELIPLIVGPVVRYLARLAVKVVLTYC